jgi:hypothetical protein
MKWWLLPRKDASEWANRWVSLAVDWALRGGNSLTVVARLNRGGSTEFIRRSSMPPSDESAVHVIPARVVAAREESRPFIPSEERKSRCLRNPRTERPAVHTQYLTVFPKNCPSRHLAQFRVDFLLRSTLSLRRCLAQNPSAAGSALCSLLEH